MSTWTVAWLIALVFGLVLAGMAYMVTAYSRSHRDVPGWIPDAGGAAGGLSLLVVLVSIPAAVWSAFNLIVASLAIGVVGGLLLWWSAQKKGTPGKGNSGLIQGVLGGICVSLFLLGLIVDAGWRLYAG